MNQTIYSRYYVTDESLAGTTGRVVGDVISAMLQKVAVMDEEWWKREVTITISQPDPEIYPYSGREIRIEAVPVPAVVKSPPRRRLSGLYDTVPLPYGPDPR